MATEAPTKRCFVISPIGAEGEPTREGLRTLAWRAFTVVAATLALGSGPAKSDSPGVRLTVVQSGTFPGTVRYTLTCAPNGGTLPHAARACAALQNDPGLLRARPGGSLKPCALGLDAVYGISGYFNGARVAVSFATCATGQSAVARQWAGLLPTDADRETVHPDIGIGLLRLGQSELRVRGLLGPGLPRAALCATCTRTYPTGVLGGEALTVDFGKYRVIQIASDESRTVIRGRPISSSLTALRYRLTSWSVQACPGGVSALEHGGATSTTIFFAGDARSVTVRMGPGRCGRP